ncbi:hypothetical protein CC1G_03883 [Coprinopsis cinerea okayama7|uniref:Uncharacterized protein n=1 Tax=Coprinopsis cinerea (strain Okayama-7 / 130 / ATCC MYA-4618 / FGSC 9003) TaxID=240176 RepID=A8NH31_COPC7|nr:hypothetical protein CC1G_03883 [Coprinopsis cinerea okayama7\|eukprot:XP_001833666.2 hypothetical protein CC1G_03883 [Coprinopsis cinerea okayama7\
MLKGILRLFKRKRARPTKFARSIMQYSPSPCRMVSNPGSFRRLPQHAVNVPPLPTPPSQPFVLTEFDTTTSLPQLECEVPLEIYMRIFQIAAEESQSSYRNLLLTSKAIYSLVHMIYLPCTIRLQTEKDAREFHRILLEKEGYGTKIRHLWMTGTSISPIVYQHHSPRKDVTSYQVLQQDIVERTNNLETLACPFHVFFAMCVQTEPPLPSTSLPTRASRYPYLKELTILDQSNHFDLSRFSLPKQITHLAFLDHPSNSRHENPTLPQISSYFPSVEYLSLEIWMRDPFSELVRCKEIGRAMLEFKYPRKRLTLTSMHQSDLYREYGAKENGSFILRIGRMEYYQWWEDRTRGIGLDGIWERPA